MIKKIYAAYDSKAQTYLNPITMHSKGEAIRAWIELSNDDRTQFCKYPADFTLFEIGEYDDEKALLLAHKTPVSIGTALEYKTQKAHLQNVSS